MITINISLVPYDKKYLHNIIDLNIKCTKDIGAYFGPAKIIVDLEDIDTYYLNSGGNFILATDDNEKLVGIGAYHRVNDTTVEIKRMRVDTDSQGKGIGKEILSFLLADAKEKGYNRFILQTSINQMGAIKFYEGFGFAKFIEETIEGITCFWLELIEPKK